MPIRRPALALALALLAAFALPAASAAKPRPPLLVMISIDGLRPDYITAADAHGARVPELRRFLREGAYAGGVKGVVPTVTYPSHTTLVTGVSPARHGILANVVFDPLHRNAEGWYWYTEDIKALTLWDAAARAGRTSAAIQWPVTVGARSITWNIPEFWRAGNAEDRKLLRSVATPGLLAEATPEVGEYDNTPPPTPEADEMRGRYAVWILEHKRPALLLLHLIALDHYEHETGPFSAEAIAVLERLDGVIGKIRAALDRLAPGRFCLAVVSDHGFTPADSVLNLFSAFKAAGLVTTNPQGQVTDWTAIPWVAGSSAAIMLKDPADSATLTRARTLLARLAADSADGVDRILDRAELAQRGGFPPAAFWVSLRPGWKMGTALDGPLVAGSKHGGAHGASPDQPDLRAAFFLIGPGVPAGKNLGLIDMRDVAPTLAARAGLGLPGAEGRDVLRR